MKFKLIKIITAITIGVIGFNIITPAFAADASICGNANVPGEVQAASGCPGEGDPGELPNVIVNILNGIIAVSGLIAVVFVIIGGVQYMTSAGDPGKTKKAKDTILYAVIGLIVCVLAFAIVNFVIKNIIEYNSEKDDNKNDKSGYMIQNDIALLEKKL